ncbi:MAG: soluble lytic murein transglycosylase-like protein [Bradymonadia bacterium]|jgi:soluble lytic murein transglycosylase-like protein
MTRALALLDTEAQVSEGIRAVERELERYPEYPFIDRVQIRVARAELELERTTAAAHRLERLVWARPYSPRAEEARELHEEFAGPIDESRGSLAERLERGRQLRLARHWPVAENVLRAAIADAVDSGASRDLTNELHFQLALNGYDSGRFDDALVELDAITANRNSGVSFYNRATWRARTLSRLDREGEAYEMLVSYYSERSGSERDHRLFEFASDLGMWDVALEHLDDRYSRERDWESWDGAFTNYMAGNHDRAARLWGRMARRHSGESEARYQYWQARAYEHLGRIPEALDLYQTVIRSQPWRYYGIQSRNRTQEWLAVLPPLEQGQTYVDLQVELPQVPIRNPGRVHWDGFGGPASGTFADLGVQDSDEFFGGYPSELGSIGAARAFADLYGEQFPEAILAADLLSVGAKEDARKELRDAIIEFRALDYSFARGRRVTETRPIRLGHKQWAMFIDNRSPELGWWGIDPGSDRFPTPSGRTARGAYAQRQMLLRENRDQVRQMIRAAAREVGDYYMVRRFALDGDLDTLSEGTPDVRWHEAYPRAYGESMREHIEEYDLNPYIAWALMIVESDMNPDTVSHAFAYGLLQVIPKTGTLCALLFGEPDFGINELLEVDGSIRYGTWYLSQLLYKFHGQEMLAMVAYNAGPHQVQRWLEWRGDDMEMDEFIETVPYDGARRYPQRVLRYVSIFRAVNGLDREVYLGNELDDTFEDNIYF